MKLKVGIYTKTLTFYVILLAILIGAYFYISSQFLSASISEVVDLGASQSSYELPVQIFKDSKVAVGNKTYTNLITSEENDDLFKYVVFSSEGVYLNSLNVVVKLPEPVNSLDELSARDYAVHGVGDTNITLLDSQTVVFSASNLIPTSTFTIELSLPKGFVEIPWYKEALYGLKQLDWYWWILIGNIPLLITLIILLYLYSKSSVGRIGARTKDVRANVPSDLSPAAASALVNGKITSRSIAATMLDMAQRGVIQIIDKGEYFTFLYNTGGNYKLRFFERMLISKIFTTEKTSSSAEDIELRISKHVFSRKIAFVYLEIYQELDKKGYFNKELNESIQSYKRIGYLMFSVGILGFILNIIFGLSSPYYLIIWFSIVLGAMLIIRIAPNLPKRNQLGIAETQKWFEFKNYLQENKPISYSYESQAMFEKYLPYAIGFGVEKEWVKRFVKQPFRVPKWIITGKDTLFIEDILSEIVPFVEFISYRLTQIKEPSV